MQKTKGEKKHLRPRSPEPYLRHVFLLCSSRCMSSACEAKSVRCCCVVRDQAVFAQQHEVSFTMFALDSIAGCRTSGHGDKAID